MHQLIIWDPNYEEISRGRKARNFVDQFIGDIGIRNEKKWVEHCKTGMVGNGMKQSGMFV